MRWRQDKPVIGWREWVSLPDLGVPAIKCKVDTGARTSALHAFSLRTFERDGVTWVRFAIHPLQRRTRPSVEAEARLFDERHVRSSSGRDELRPVIETTAVLRGHAHAIQLTLARRDEMGFRMLLGRQAVRGVYVIDPAHSYLGGKPQTGGAER
ncbi:MAG TPA: RimK/LysX family protein [Actinomycetota bacterium]